MNHGFPPRVRDVIAARVAVPVADRALWLQVAVAVAEHLLAVRRYGGRRDAQQPEAGHALCIARAFAPSS